MNVFFFILLFCSTIKDHPLKGDMPKFTESEHDPRLGRDGKLKLPDDRTLQFFREYYEKQFLDKITRPEPPKRRQSLDLTLKIEEESQIDEELGADGQDLEREEDTAVSSKKKTRQDSWNKKEDDLLLKGLKEGKSMREIRENHLRHRSRTALYNRKKVLREKLAKNEQGKPELGTTCPRWTEEEDLTLVRAVEQGFTNQEILKYVLPLRSLSAIEMRKCRLHLNPQKRTKSRLKTDPASRTKASLRVARASAKWANKSGKAGSSKDRAQSSKTQQSKSSNDNLPKVKVNNSMPRVNAFASARVILGSMGRAQSPMPWSKVEDQALVEAMGAQNSSEHIKKYILQHREIDEINKRKDVLGCKLHQNAIINPGLCPGDHLKSLVSCFTKSGATQAR